MLLKQEADILIAKADVISQQFNERRLSASRGSSLTNSGAARNSAAQSVIQDANWNNNLSVTQSVMSVEN